MIYPTLILLEELGHVTVSPGEGANKLHATTNEGQAFLNGNRAALQVLRAMESLKLALRMRLSNGPLSNEQVTGIAATATAIEDLQ